MLKGFLFDPFRQVCIHDFTCRPLSHGSLSSSTWNHSPRSHKCTRSFHHCSPCYTINSPPCHHQPRHIFKELSTDLWALHKGHAVATLTVLTSVATLLTTLHPPGLWTSWSCAKGAVAQMLRKVTPWSHRQILRILRTCSYMFNISYIFNNGRAWPTKIKFLILI